MDIGQLLQEHGFMMCLWAGIGVSLTFALFVSCIVVTIIRPPTRFKDIQMPPPPQLKDYLD